MQKGLIHNLYEKYFLNDKAREIYESSPALVFGHYVGMLAAKMGFPYYFTAKQNQEIMNAVGIYVDDWKVMHRGEYDVYPAYEIMTEDNLQRFVEYTYVAYSEWVKSTKKIPFELAVGLKYFPDCGWTVEVIPTGVLDKESHKDVDVSGLIVPLPVRYIMTKGYKPYKGFLLVEASFDDKIGCTEDLTCYEDYRLSF